MHLLLRVEHSWHCIYFLGNLLWHEVWWFCFLKMYWPYIYDKIYLLQSKQGSILLLKLDNLFQLQSWPFVFFTNLRPRLKFDTIPWIFTEVKVNISFTYISTWKALRCFFVIKKLSDQFVDSRCTSQGENWNNWKTSGKVVDCCRKSRERWMFLCKGQKQTPIAFKDGFQRVHDIFYASKWYKR